MEISSFLVGEKMSSRLLWRSWRRVEPTWWGSGRRCVLYFFATHTASYWHSYELNRRLQLPNRTLRWFVGCCWSIISWLWSPLWSTHPHCSWTSFWPGNSSTNFSGCLLVLWPRPIWSSRLSSLFWTDRDYPNTNCRCYPYRLACLIRKV